MGETIRQPNQLHRKRRRGILKPSSHSSRRFVPCSLIVWGIPITFKTFFLGTLQLLLPVSMCSMGYTVELTFGDWILRVLVIFTLALVVLLFLVDTTLNSSSSSKKPGCRIKIMPAERKRSVITPSKAILLTSYKTSNQSPYHKIVSFAKGTKFFRLPRPKSKRQLLREQHELQQQQQQQSQSTNRSHTPLNLPTLAGMTPPPPKGFATQMDSTPDWKRAHRLLRQAMRDPPARKHDSDEREDLSASVGEEQRDVRDEAQSVSKHLFRDKHSDGFDADSERDDDDTADNLSAPGSVVDRDDMDGLMTDGSSKLSQHKSSCSSTVLALVDDEDSMILFEDDDDTYEETMPLGNNSCYSPLRASESEDTLEEELEEALAETVEQLSPTRLWI